MKHIEKIVIGMIAVLFVVIVMIATDFWLLWLPLEHSSEYPQKVAALFMALTAFVTLLVVYATFNATKQSNLREQERRKDEIKKEERDRKERLLNDIIDWAEAITTFLSAQIVTDMTNESRIRTDAANRLKELNGLAAKGIRIELLASLLFLNNDDLLRDIPNFRLRISKHTNFLILVVKRKVKYVEKGAKAEGIHGGRLLNDALNLIRLATRIYTDIK